MNDASIIELYWERSEEAISETDKKYGKLCNNIANNILNNKSDAEECVNDTYLTVWDSIPDERPKYFSAYICRIVKNLSLKRLEYNTAQKRNPELLVSFNELQECLSSDTNPESNLDAEELGKTIGNFLRQQNETNRKIFLRRYWYFDSIKSIASDFKMKEERVSLILFRTRKKLKQYLEKEGYKI